MEAASLRGSFVVAISQHAATSSAPITTSPTPPPTLASPPPSPSQPPASAADVVVQSEQSANGTSIGNATKRSSTAGTSNASRDGSASLDASASVLSRGGRRGGGRRGGKGRGSGVRGRGGKDGDAAAAVADVDDAEGETATTSASDDADADADAEAPGSVTLVPTVAAAVDASSTSAAGSSSSSSSSSSGGDGGSATARRSVVPPKNAGVHGPPTQRPNVVLMVADDLDVDDVGSLSNGATLTPNLDNIGRRGAVFTSAHAAAPLCAPSRFAILTGLRPQCAHTSTDLRGAAEAAATPGTISIPPAVSYDTAPRPSRHATVGHRLQSLGYATGIAGLWHLGLPEPVSPRRDLRKVEETPGSRFAVAGAGKVKRTVLAEYAALQEHVMRVGGFDEAERVYAAPLDMDGVALPKAMRVRTELRRNVDFVSHACRSR